MNQYSPDELPDNILAIARSKSPRRDSYWVNDEKDIVYRDFGDMRLPCVMWNGGNVQIVETIPSQKQDAGDLHEYPDVVRFARNGEKDERTCRWVSAIHDQFVICLLSKAYYGYLPRETIMLHRGMVEQAKFTAMRIWRAGAV